MGLASQGCEFVPEGPHDIHRNEALRHSPDHFAAPDSEAYVDLCAEFGGIRASRSHTHKMLDVEPGRAAVCRARRILQETSTALPGTPEVGARRSFAHDQRVSCVPTPPPRADARGGHAWPEPVRPRKTAAEFIHEGAYVMVDGSAGLVFYSSPHTTPGERLSFRRPRRPPGAG